MNNQRQFLYLGVSLLVAIFFSLSSCNEDSASPKTAYQLAVLEALARGEKADSLIGGLYFGMNQAVFFDYCKVQQKLGRMTDGADNMIRVVVDSSAIPGMSVLEFYPGFNEKGEINSLRGRIYSLQWAPWSKQFDAVNLLPQGQEYLLEQLKGGAEFKQYESAKENTLVKLDGNRRVVLYPHEYAQERLVFFIHNLNEASEDVLNGIDMNPAVYPTIAEKPQ